MKVVHYLSYPAVKGSGLLARLESGLVIHVLNPDEKSSLDRSAGAGDSPPVVLLRSLDEYNRAKAQARVTGATYL